VSRTFELPQGVWQPYQAEAWAATGSVSRCFRPPATLTAPYNVATVRKRIEHAGSAGGTRDSTIPVLRVSAVTLRTPGIS